MQKAGNVQAMLKNGPFGSGPEAQEQLKEGERKLKRFASYIGLFAGAPSWSSITPRQHKLPMARAAKKRPAFFNEVALLAREGSAS